MQSDRKRWNEKYKRQETLLTSQPHPFLRKNLKLLPRGRALEIAAGEGRNAVFLARHGFSVEAVDISAVALKKARRLAREAGVRIRTLRADLDAYPIEEEAYDLILNFYFLDRRLIPAIQRGLKKGGRLVFETYTVEQPSLGGGPHNPQYLLHPNELLRLFRDLHILLYREGTFREGGSKKAIASLIATKI